MDLGYGDEYGSFRPPLFPLFLAGVYRTFGVGNYLAARIILCALSSLTCVLIYSLGKKLFDL